jgi:helicase MOV-10
VKLTNNYRSHEAILKFPNDRFYGGELIPCADIRIRNVCLGRPILPTHRFPVVFHAMSGEDLREASSPSFFNIHEAQEVKAYIKKLRDDRVLKICEIQHYCRWVRLVNLFFSYEGYRCDRAISRSMPEDPQGVALR